MYNSSTAFKFLQTNFSLQLHHLQKKNTRSKWLTELNTVLFYFNFGHPEFSSPIPIAQSLTDNAFEKRFSNCESCTLIEAGKYSQDSTPYRRKLDKWQREPQKQKQNKAIIQSWFYQCLHCWPFVVWQLTIINHSQLWKYLNWWFEFDIHLPNLQFNKQVKNRYIPNEV